MNYLYRNALKNINYGLRFYSSDTAKVVAPKKPSSSFLLFCGERRKTSFSKGSQKDFIIESGKIWSSLSDIEKQPYIDEANLASQKYRIELESLSDFEMDQIRRERKEKRLRMEKRREKNLKKKMGLPRRSTSAYCIFLADQLRGKEKIKTIFKETAAKWNGLSEAEKKVYYEENAKDKERFEKEMESFIDKMITNNSEYLIPQTYLARRKKKERLIERGAKLEESLNKVREKFDNL